MTHKIKTRPILMNGAMVRATLAGAKTQTRRIVKGIALSWLDAGLTPEFVCDTQNDIHPYGRKGDQLYVRESFSLVPDNDEPAGHSAILYAADGDQYGKLTPSIHMPRWASRIILEITGVRVERLHDISTEDIIAEGLSTTLRGYDAECDLRDQWRKLLESTGGNWDANEWLWVINFKRVTP